MECRLQKKIQTAVNGTANTLATSTGKLLQWKFISEPNKFQNKKTRKKTEIPVDQEITPKARYSLRGIDGKYSQQNEVLRDILAGKLKLVQNTRKLSDSEIEEREDNEDNDFDDYHTSEKGHQKLIHVNVNTEDELQNHNDGEITNSQKLNNTVQNENEKKFKYRNKSKTVKPRIETNN